MKLGSISALVVLSMSLVVGPAMADSDDDDKQNFWNTGNFEQSKWGVSLDAKFNPANPDGTEVMDSTRFLAKTNNVKVLYQINQLCKSDCSDGKAYAVGNIMNHINDYTITHGMDEEDYEIVVIVHSSGWKMVLDNDSTSPKYDGNGNQIMNPVQAQMEMLLAQPSVKVLFCQNTANGKGIVKSNMIEGIGYVTAGVSAISDLQELGYRYVQP